MYPEETSVSVGYQGRGVSDCAPSRFSMTDRIGSMVSNASETYSLLAAQHERLFGPVPARPEAITSNGKSPAPPSAMDALGALNEYLQRIEHVSRCIADRI